MNKQEEVFLQAQSLLLAINKNFNLKGAKFEMILKDLGLMPFPHYFILLLLNSLGEE